MGTTFIATVIGTPRPQGSQRAIRVNDHYVMKSAPTLTEWRNAAITQLADAAQVAGWRPVEAATWVWLDFRFLRPKSHSRKRRATDGGVKPDGPDLDKLVRAIFDSLTAARIVTDDSVIVSVWAGKRYVTDTEYPGVTVKVHT